MDSGSQLSEGSENMNPVGCSSLKECTEDYDSDDDYASIQRPAFSVEGEPNFDSGPPEDGWEYLRRVRYYCNCHALKFYLFLLFCSL